MPHPINFFQKYHKSKPYQNFDRFPQILQPDELKKTGSMRVSLHISHNGRREERSISDWKIVDRERIPSPQNEAWSITYAVEINTLHINDFHSLMPVQTESDSMCRITMSYERSRSPAYIKTVSALIDFFNSLIEDRTERPRTFFSARLPDPCDTVLAAYLQLVMERDHLLILAVVNSLNQQLKKSEKLYKKSLILNKTAEQLIAEYSLEKIASLKLTEPAHYRLIADYLLGLYEKSADTENFKKSFSKQLTDFLIKNESTGDFFLQPPSDVEDVLEIFEPSEEEVQRYTEIMKKRDSFFLSAFIAYIMDKPGRARTLYLKSLTSNDEAQDLLSGYDHSIKIRSLHFQPHPALKSRCTKMTEACDELGYFLSAPYQRTSLEQIESYADRIPIVSTPPQSCLTRAFSTPCW